MIIACASIAFFIALLSWHYLDRYCKMSGKPLLKHKLVRYFCAHCGRYWKNMIRRDGVELMLPSVEDRYTVSVLTFVLQYISFAVFVLLIILGCIVLGRAFDVITLIAVIILVLYFIFACVIWIAGVRLAIDQEKAIGERKFRHLAAQGVKNQLSCSAVEELLQSGQTFRFSVYGLLFEVRRYRDTSSWEFLDITHDGGCLAVNKRFSQIFEIITINGKSLQELWKYLEVQPDRSTESASKTKGEIFRD